MTISFVQREATPAEILADRAMYIRHSMKVRYRHFMMERFAPRAKNGVQHRQYSSGRLYVQDGRPFVLHGGEMLEVTASVTPLASGTEIVWDLRLKSEYLKPL